MTAYLEQTFQRSRGHIAVLQVVFGLVNLPATAGAIIAWRTGRRILALKCLLAWGCTRLSPVDGELRERPEARRAGVLFGYLLAGVALERLWRAGSRVAIAFSSPS